MPCSLCGKDHPDFRCTSGATARRLYAQRQAQQLGAAGSQDGAILAYATMVLRDIKEQNILDNNIIDPDNRADLEVDDRLTELREDLDGCFIVPGAINGTAAGIQHVATQVRLRKVGNCQEQAYLAFHMIHGNPAIRPLQLLRWGEERGTNHVAVLAGPGGRAGVVCDPWATLCCPVEFYETDFRAQMGRWQHNGLKIAGPDDSMLNPTDFANLLFRQSPTPLYTLRE